MLQQFESEIQPINSKLRRLFRDGELERHKAMAEQTAIGKCWTGALAAGLTDTSTLKEYRALDAEKAALDQQYRVELKRIVGAQQFDTWPGLALRPRQGDLAQGPVPDADPDAPVFYMRDDMMNSTVQQIGD